MRITLVWAQASNGVIGNCGEIPWRIAEDLKHFSKLTSGHSVLMGSRTWRSLPIVARPLPNRKNYVVSRHTTIAPGAVVIPSINEGINSCHAAGCQELFIIGGEQIYKESIDLAHRLIITHIPLTPEGDRFAPIADKSKWIVSSVTYFSDVDQLTSSKVDCSIAECIPKPT